MENDMNYVPKKHKKVKVSDSKSNLEKRLWVWAGVGLSLIVLGMAIDTEVIGLTGVFTEFGVAGVYVANRLKY